MWEISFEHHRFFSTDLKVRTKLHVFFITDPGVRGFSHLPPRRTPLEGRKSWSLKELLFTKAFQVCLQITVYFVLMKTFRFRTMYSAEIFGHLSLQHFIDSVVNLPCRFLVNSLKKKVCKTQELFALVKSTRLKHFQIHILVNMVKLRIWDSLELLERR